MVAFVLPISIWAQDKKLGKVPCPAGLSYGITSSQAIKILVSKGGMDLSPDGRTDYKSIEFVNYLDTLCMVDPYFKQNKLYKVEIRVYGDSTEEMYSKTVGKLSKLYGSPTWAIVNMDTSIHVPSKGWEYNNGTIETTYDGFDTSISFMSSDFDNLSLNNRQYDVKPPLNTAFGMTSTQVKAAMKGHRGLALANSQGILYVNVYVGGFPSEVTFVMHKNIMSGVLVSIKDEDNIEGNYRTIRNNMIKKYGTPEVEDSFDEGSGQVRTIWQFKNTFALLAKDEEGVSVMYSNKALINKMTRDQAREF